MNPSRSTTGRVSLRAEDEGVLIERVVDGAAQQRAGRSPPAAARKAATMPRSPPAAMHAAGGGNTTRQAPEASLGRSRLMCSAGSLGGAAGRVGFKWTNAVVDGGGCAIRNFQQKPDAGHQPANMAAPTASPASTVTVLVVGAGQRGSGYAEYVATSRGAGRVVAVCEPLAKRRAGFAARHNLPDSACFASWEQVHERIADAAFVCNQDADHADAVVHLVGLGFDILCEKPMSTTMASCLRMRDAVRAAGVLFGVCHVLRYSPYFAAVRHAAERDVGRVMHVDHEEAVGWFHFAHSYVRGNWARECESAPSLLAKACHDLDLLLHVLVPPPPSPADDDVRPLQPRQPQPPPPPPPVLGARRWGPVRVTSFGGLAHFRRDRKPPAAGNATRCLDCAVERSCAYSATRIYLDRARAGDDHWPVSVVCGEDIEDLRAARGRGIGDDDNGDGDGEPALVALVRRKLRDGPYGRCAYECDNDVCDHQVVALDYGRGAASAAFSMSAHTADVSRRRTRLHGSRGEADGDMSQLVTTDFASGARRVVFPPRGTAGDSSDPERGHAGGDRGIVAAFLAAAAARDQALLGCTIDDAFESHALVFAAEAARKESRVVDLDEFIAAAEAETAVAATAAAEHSGTDAPES
ncbi:hypothetical protein HK405_010811, partial [Cladochytrium tenue]